MKARLTEETTSDKLKRYIHQYFGITFTFSILMISLRGFELWMLYLKDSLPSNYSSLFGTGLLYDAIFISRMVVIYLPFFILFSLINEKIALWISRLLICVFVLSYLALIQYFETTRIPLGSDLFGYSLKEISQTLNAGGGFTFMRIFPFLIFLPFCLFLNLIFNRIRISNWFLLVFLLPFFMSILTPINARPQNNQYNQDFEYYLVSNKADFFLYNSIDYYQKSSIPNIALEDKTILSNGKYPLNRLAKDPDVLGPMFNKFSRKPNIVIVIVEGLGRAYSGPDAYEGSFTPFLDKLGPQSIYFDNFLANQGRTFGVLPSLLASLPLVEKGFTAFKDTMPNHLSLISILKKNGYYSSFLYGGDASFDDMEMFLNYNQIDRIVQEKDFERRFTKMRGSGNGFSWGYGDQDLFKKGLDVTDKNNTTPRLDIYLTLSTHNPFMINNQEYYKNKFYKILDTSNISSESKADSKGYALEYSTFVAFDEAIEYFINRYKKERPDFENTIFIITGDHRIPETPIATKADRYHVPLIIYSPKLKNPKRIASVSSQLDVVPSLLAFLQNNYSIELPTEISWVGNGLDTTKKFSSNKEILMMGNKNNVGDFIMKDRMYSNGTLFNVYNKLDLEKLENPNKALVDKMTQSFNSLKNKHFLVAEKNRIVSPEQMEFIK